MNAAQAIDVITEAGRGEDRIRALYLSGSHATGLQDDYSDLDFLLVTPDGASDDTAALWKRLVLETGPLVMWRDRIVRPALINAITENWLRIDAVLLPPEQMATYAKDSLRVLFDRDGLHMRLGEKTGSASDKPPAQAISSRSSSGFSGCLQWPSADRTSSTGSRASCICAACLSS